MKTTFSTFMVVLATVLAVGCAKNDSGGGGGGGGNSYVNPPNPCTPDQFGNIAYGCGGNTSPGFSGLYGSMSPINNSDSEYNGIVRVIKNIHMYPIFRTAPMGFNGYMSGGFFVVTGGMRTPFRAQCGTDDNVWGYLQRDTCANECKNFRSHMSLYLTTSGSQGTLQILAQYRAPGGCDARENGLERAADIRVQVFPTGGNTGFTVQSLNGYPNWGKNIRIDIPSGSLTVRGTYSGTMSLNGQPVGSVTLTRQ